MLHDWPTGKRDPNRLGGAPQACPLGGQSTFFSPSGGPVRTIEPPVWAIEGSGMRHLLIGVTAALTVAPWLSSTSPGRRHRQGLRHNGHLRLIPAPVNHIPSPE